MVVVQCPVTDCNYVTEDVTPELVTALIKLHAVSHEQPVSSTAVKPEKVKRPTVALAGSSEDWQYFITRWNEYKAATKINNGDIVSQCLGCCEEPICKDHTRNRNAGCSLSIETEHTVLNE